MSKVIDKAIKRAGVVECGIRCDSCSDKHVPGNSVLKTLRYNYCMPCAIEKRLDGKILRYIGSGFGEPVDRR